MFTCTFSFVRCTSRNVQLRARRTLTVRWQCALWPVVNYRLCLARRSGNYTQPSSIVLHSHAALIIKHKHTILKCVAMCTVYMPVHKAVPVSFKQV
jgi:hypothetical protein